MCTLNPKLSAQVELQLRLASHMCSVSNAHTQRRLCRKVRMHCTSSVLVLKHSPVHTLPMSKSVSVKSCYAIDVVSVCTE